MKDKKTCPPCIKTSIGGQALIEGIMMRGPKMTAMAVRNPDGEIVLEKSETKPLVKSKICKVPFIRGIFGFIDSMVLGYRSLMRSAEIAGLEEEDDKKKKDAGEEGTADVVAEESNGDLQDGTEDKKKEKKSSGALLAGVMVVGTVLGILLAVALFILLPAWLFSLLVKAFPSLDNNVLRSVFEGVFKVIILVGYMALVSLMKDIRRTFMYHGAEHKTIFCYEKGLELTVDNVREQRRFHPRCGTSFLILIVLVSVVISMFIFISSPLLRTLVKLLLLPVTMGVGYELIKLAGRHDNILTRIISAPGLWLQRITVLEPTDDMIECAIKAVKEVIPDDGSDHIK